MSQLVTLPNIVWRIKDLSAATKFSSPLVTFMGMKWKLTAVRLPNTYNHWDSKIQLTLERTSPSLNLEAAELEFSVDTYIMVKDGTPTMKTEAYSTISYDSWCVWSKTMREIESYFKNFSIKSAVTFLVSLNLRRGSTQQLNITDVIEQQSTSIPSWATSLSKDFSRLLLSETHSDVVLNCDDKSYYAHRAILSARSEVFAAMFQSDMKESIEGIVDITDMKPFVLISFLCYLYTGDIPEWSVDTAREIHAVADKYRVEPLRIKCALYVSENFAEGNESNPDETTEQTTDESDETHKKEENSAKQKLLKELFLTLEWRALREGYPELASEMCRPLMAKEF